MSGVDVEGVLRDHMFSLSTNKCVCGVGPRGGQNWFDHRAHVAAVLREQIAAVWDEGYNAGQTFGHEYAQDTYDGDGVRPANPYRAAQVAPSRVPGEET